MSVRRYARDRGERLWIVLANTTMRRFRDWLRSLLTLHGSRRGIAGGFAMGFGLSLVPIPAAGMIVALALVPVLRLNPAATYLGSAFVNPITGPFVYYFILWLGLTLLGQVQPSWEQLSALDGAGWWHLFGDLLVPFLAGGVVLAPTGGVLAYLAVYYAIGRWRAHVGPRSDASASEHDREKALSSATNERGSAGADNSER